MLENWIRAYLLVGILTFGLRSVLIELGLPGWAPMLSFALIALAIYGVQNLGRIIHYPRHVGSMLDDHLRNADSGDRALSA